jgi:hypothetical protein
MSMASSDLEVTAEVGRLAEQLREEGGLRT